MNIKRNLKDKVMACLAGDEIIIITGARQVGKTTLLSAVRDELVQQQLPVLFLNLDIDAHSPYFSSQGKLLQKIMLEIGETGYVFIDEIQRLENAGLFLKGLSDRKLNYKFVVTGSGSIELKGKIKESLAGRKRTFEMMPVGFREFVHFKTGYKYAGKLDLFFEVEQEEAQYLLEEYLNFGGYPRIITEKQAGGKRMAMQEIYDSYVEKDLVYLLGIERAGAFYTLLKLLATQNGQIIKYSNLATQAGIAVPTLKKYLWYAEKTFSIHYVSPYFTNPVKEITKSPVYYFNDLGLRNFALGTMGRLTAGPDMGFVFQNFVFLLLKAYANQHYARIHFWRTTDQAEVDFVLSGENGIVPVEVKYTDFRNPKFSRSFHSFLERYQPREAWIINTQTETTYEVKGIPVKVMPYYKLI